MTKEKLKTKENTARYFNSRDISPLSNDIQLGSNQARDLRVRA